MCVCACVRVRVSIALLIFKIALIIAVIWLQMPSACSVS